jgi:hypothetical protein
MKSLFEQWEKDFIRLAYPLSQSKDIATILNRTTPSIQKFIRKYKIKKPYPCFQIGEKIGSLEIISEEILKKSGSKRRTHYICICRCGAEIYVRRENLIDNQQSCKMCRDASRTGYGVITGDIFSRIKRTAALRKHHFDLEPEYLHDLIIKQNFRCALSNREIYINTKRINGKILSKNTTASLDRIDSKIGYVVGNVQWVHKIANIIKNILSMNDLAEWSRDIYLYNKHLIGE